MSERRPADRFGRDELIERDERTGSSELEDATQMGRRIEASVAPSVRPSADFADRVMAAVAREPLPAPAVAAGAALRRGRLAAVAGAIADGWRVLVGGGYPLAARVQALALVIVAVVMVGSALTLGVVGAMSLLQGPDAAPETPLPSVTVGPGPTGSPDAPPSPSPIPSPSARASAAIATASPAASASESAFPTGTPAAPATPPASGAASPSETPTGTAPPSASPSPEPTRSPAASATTRPGPGPSAAPTTRPTATPSS